MESLIKRGFKVGGYSDRPGVPQQLLWLWNAYCRMRHASKDEPIPLTEIVAWITLKRIDDQEDVDNFIQIIEELEAVYSNWLAKTKPSGITKTKHRRETGKGSSR